MLEKGETMRYLCQYTWQAGTTAEAVGQRFLDLHQHNSGPPPGLTFESWDELVGGGAGAIIVSTDDPRRVNEALVPWMDLVSWDVREVIASSYDEILQRMQERQQQA